MLLSEAPLDFLSLGFLRGLCNISWRIFHWQFTGHAKESLRRGTICWASTTSTRRKHSNGVRIRYPFCGHVLHYLEDPYPMNHSEASSMQSLVSLSLPGVRVENLSAVDLLSERKKFTYKSFLSFIHRKFFFLFFSRIRIIKT